MENYHRKRFNDNNEAKFSSDIYIKAISFTNNVLKEFKNLKKDGIKINENYYEFIINE